MTPPPDQLSEFARRDTAAWCSQDPLRVAENYAPDGSLTIKDGPPSVGRARITEAARSFMVAFPDMRVLMDDLVVENDHVEYRWTLVGTNTGPGGTGRRIRISGSVLVLAPGEFSMVKRLFATGCRDPLPARKEVDFQGGEGERSSPANPKARRTNNCSGSARAASQRDAPMCLAAHFFSSCSAASERDPGSGV